MALVNQAEYAAQHGVSRKTVTKWKTAGYLVFSDGMVDAEASDAVLRERGLGRFAGVTSAPEGNAETGAKGNTRAAPTKGNAPADSAAPASAAAAETDIEDLEQRADRFIKDVLAGRYANFATAETIKENALALMRLLDVRQKAGLLVEIALAERILFEAFRGARDSWLNWPARVGPLLAADLGLEADKVTEALTAHVHKHLAELGEPAADFGREG